MRQYNSPKGLTPSYISHPDKGPSKKTLKIQLSLLVEEEDTLMR